MWSQSYTKYVFIVLVICSFLIGIYIININILQDVKPIRSIQLSRHSHHVNSFNGNEITLVTAYFNIGPFTKTANVIFSNRTYYNWMKSFQYVNNSVILYTDQIDFSVQFKLYRKHFASHMTKIFILNQTSLWAFRLQPQIKEIYHQKGYPTPGIPAYSSTMHAKYELIGKVINEQIYTTTYLAWIDIGYFRKIKYECFKMKPPKNMKYDHISFTQVEVFNPNLTFNDIMYHTKYYIAGGLFIGKPKYLLLFIEDYKMAVERFLKMKLMNSDQQILYAMYSAKVLFHPRIPIQTFFHNDSLRTGRHKQWFYLGSLCSEVNKQNVSNNDCISN